MKYIDAEKLKAEIDNLESFSCISEEQDGFYSAISRINGIIDSLQQEQPEVDLEKEYKEYVEDDPVFSRLTNRNVGLRIARHFYELGSQSKPEAFDTAAFQLGVQEGRRLEKEGER